MKKFFVIILAVLCAVFALVFVACDEGADAADASFGITYNDCKITLGADADKVLQKLGEPTSTREIGDCGGLGAQVKYSYASIDVFVLESKSDGNIIDAISLRDDTVQTDQGVYIGMNESEAKQKMDGASEKNGALILTKGKYSVKVQFEGGTVSDIDYITAS